MAIEDPFVGLPVDRNATDRDIVKIREQLNRIEQMLVVLTPSPKRHDPEALASALNEAARRFGYRPTGWSVQYDGTLQMGGFYKERDQ